MSANCRFCNAKLKHTFVDLGVSPLANSFLKQKELAFMEPFYPLHAYVCDNCFLVQLEEFEAPENIFDDYVYFSSYSTSWLEHCKKYSHDMISKLSLDKHSMVVEVASNDGYLLQYFKEAEIPVLGIEPARNVAEVAITKGIPTDVSFFNGLKGRELCSRGVRADLIVANNVLAHVPDVNNFVQGISFLLNENGVATFEFPHLLCLITEAQFDTIYHEHFSYLSLTSASRIFNAQGLEIYDVEELPTHGGSLRLYVQRFGGPHPVREAVNLLLTKERIAGLMNLEFYEAFAMRVKRIKRKLLLLMIDIKENNKSIVAYGAAAKGNTLLNYTGIRADFIDYVLDKNPHKQGTWLPGVRLPVYPVEKIYETKPDYILVLPWNLTDEITRQLEDIKDWGGKFIIPIPVPMILG